jgi:hypothetical protein
LLGDTHKESFHARPGGFKALTGELRGRDESQGTELNGSEIKKLYSKELRSLFIECTVRYSILKPTSGELQIRVRHGLETALRGGERGVLFDGDARVNQYKCRDKLARITYINSQLSSFSFSFSIIPVAIIARDLQIPGDQE